MNHNKQMRITISFLVISFFLSCKEHKRFMRYENGDIKSIHYYGNDNGLDSSIFYSKKQQIEKAVYYKKDDGFGFCIKYNLNGQKIAEGNIVDYDAGQRTGKWGFYKKNTDSIVEYVKINNSPYVNQIWVIDKKTKDTIKNSGNYYYIFLQDTILLTDTPSTLSIADTIKLRFYLYAPYYHYHSEMLIIMPENESELKEDFSNFYEIERDTFYSLKNDGISHPEIPKAVPKNHNANFGIIYNKPGKKRIRGYIAEYIGTKGKNEDSINREERRLYFDKTVYIKDTIK